MSEIKSNPKSRNLNSEELARKDTLDNVISVAGEATPGALESDSHAPQTQEEIEKARRDEALFQSLQKKKKKKRRKVIRTVIIIVLLLAILGVAGVWYLRRKVAISVKSSSGDVLSYDATVGSISTTVSGSGTLADVDVEYVNVPDGVEIEEVTVSANQKVEKGNMIARLDMATVRTSIASVQEEIHDIDSQISDAATETVNKNVTAGVTGRVKKIYAEKGQGVVECMYDNGALAVLSLDGYLAFDMEAGNLSAGDTVRVIRGNESHSEIKGRVESVTTGTAVILVSDNGPEVDETVTAMDSEGKTLGTGILYIHKPLRVTGITGTIYQIYVTENRQVGKGDVLFVLGDTSYSANYETLLKQRAKKEEVLLELMQLNRDGALLAPFTGSVAEVIYDDGTSTQTSSDSSSSTTATTSTQTPSEEGKIDIIRLSPDKKMEISISVYESDILSLELGQTATITVNSISDTTFTGKVTEINKTATSSSGVTRYSAVVTLKKDEQMLPGMSAKVVIRIQGVDNAVIIPVDALHQTSSSSYVYTTYDEEMKEYGGLTEVEAGISNSSYVEIISGLNEGDTVWYTESQSNSWGSMGFGGGMPDFGGGMPGGGFSGGMPGGGGSFNGGGMPGAGGGRR